MQVRLARRGVSPSTPQVEQGIAQQGGLQQASAVAERPSVHLTIGNFDGVHRGHRALIEDLVRTAAADHKPAVLMSFYPHTRAVIRGDAVAPLATLRQRRVLFRELGLSCWWLVHFTPRLARLSAEDFLAQYILAHLQPARLLIGYDFALGHRRAASEAQLTAYARRHGFAIDAFPPWQYDGDVVSSTRIRERLAAADLEGAARLLGRPFSVYARVKRGEQRGRRLGFPTLNQPLAVPLPLRHGVYASWVQVGSRVHAAVSNYGVRPTFGARRPLLETHVLDFRGDLYRRLVNVTPRAFLRSERRFSSPERLAEQLQADVTLARGHHAAAGVLRPLLLEESATEAGSAASDGASQLA